MRVLVLAAALLWRPRHRPARRRSPTAATSRCPPPLADSNAQDWMAWPVATTPASAGGYTVPTQGEVAGRLPRPDRRRPRHPDAVRRARARAPPAARRPRQGDGREHGPRAQAGQRRGGRGHHHRPAAVPRADVRAARGRRRAGHERWLRRADLPDRRPRADVQPDAGLGHQRLQGPAGRRHDHQRRRRRADPHARGGAAHADHDRDGGRRAPHVPERHAAAHGADPGTTGPTTSSPVTLPKKKSAKVRRKRVKLPVRCDGPSPCTGRLALSRKSKPFGSAPFALTAGQTERVSVKLPASARRAPSGSTPGSPSRSSPRPRPA